MAAQVERPEAPRAEPLEALRAGQREAPRVERHVTQVCAA
jgi:hypothetical protein